MIVIACLSCHAALRVSPGEEGECESIFGPGSDFYPDGYLCFRCEGKAELIERADPEALRALELVEVTPLEALAALSGLGVPTEQECSPTAVSELFKSQQVVRVKTRPIRNSHRSLLDVIEFGDGSRLFLGASALGATVYRISRPHRYAEAV